MKTLLMVDLQNDFCPGGALAVPAGDEVIPLANRLQEHFDLVLATQDWHPPDHGSFASRHPGRKPGEVIELDGLQQVLWPDHCVAGSRGAELVKALRRDRIRWIFRKGTDPRIDSYSGFFDNARRKATGLGKFLASKSIRSLTILGLATDYCVKYTALDARLLGFETVVVVDACRGVGLTPDDVDTAWREMRKAGVRIVDSGEIGLAPESS